GAPLQWRDLRLDRQRRVTGLTRPSTRVHGSPLRVDGSEADGIGVFAPESTNPPTSGALEKPPTSLSKTSLESIDVYYTWKRMQNATDLPSSPGIATCERVPALQQVDGRGRALLCIEGHIVQVGNPTYLEGRLRRADTSERRLWHVTDITAEPDDPGRSPARLAGVGPQADREVRAGEPVSAGQRVRPLPALVARHADRVRRVRRGDQARLARRGHRRAAANPRRRRGAFRRRRLGDLPASGAGRLAAG